MRPEDVPAEWVALAMQGWRTPRMHINTEPERTEARLRDALAAVLPEVQAQELRDAADEMEAEYEERTAKSGAYGQTKIRAALLTASGMCNARAARLTATTEEPTT